MHTDAEALVRRAEALGCTLAQAGAARLLAYLDAMLEANRSLSLTAIRDREEAVVRHVLDSLAPAGLALAPRRCLDLGSGNGFPGVALATLWPDAEVVLMERTGKKVRAMQQCLQQARVPRCTALQMDAAMASALQPGLTFDLVAARALAPVPRAAALAAPLTAPGGKLLLWQGAGSTPAPAGFRIAGQLDYELPPPCARRLALVLYERVPS